MQRRRGGSIMTAALVAVLIVDVVLVVLVLRPRTPPDEGLQVGVAAEDTTDPGAASPTGTGSPTATAPETSASASPTPDGPPMGVQMTRLLDATSATSAWRVSTGSCPDGGGTVERTDDGGRSWAAVDAGLAEHIRLKADGQDSAFVVGLGDDCRPVFVRTRDGGATWASSTASLDVAWHIDPAQRTRVHAPQQTVDGPCQDLVVDLAPVSSQVAGVLCSDGRVFSTDDAGSSWRELFHVRGAVALTEHPAGYAVAVLGAPGCSGLTLATVSGDGLEMLSCSEVPGRAGEVALSAAGRDVWLWSGDVVRRSGDGGRSWS